MSTGPRDRVAVGRDCDDVDDEDAANQAHAASTPTSARTAKPRFIENTLTVPGDSSAAAAELPTRVHLADRGVDGFGEPARSR